MTRWYRHYAGLSRDEKLVRVAIKSKQTIERVVWVWGAILESAAEVNDNGRFDFDIGEASYFLRADEIDVGAIIDALGSLGRIHEGSVVHWGDRQFSSDSSAERQKRFRNKHKTAHRHNSDDEVTDESRHGDAPYTETELETEKDSEATASAAVPSSPIAKPKYIDAKHELWGEGKPMLLDLGVSQSRCGALIGQWCKESGDDYAGVLDAIARAREFKPMNPIPWIVQALPKSSKRKGNGNGQRGKRTIFDVIDSAQERLDEMPDRLGDDMREGTVLSLPTTRI